MRKLVLVGLLLAAGGGAVALGVQGCASVSCDETETCPGSSSDGATDGPPSDHQLTDGSIDGKNHKDAGEGGGMDSTTDGDTGPAPCNASDTPQQDPCVISEAYGVFVAPATDGGSDSGDGSRKHPYATFAKAIPAATAGHLRVYACGATYAEALSVGTAADGIQIYGGLACPVAGDGGVADAGTVDSSTGPWSYNGTVAAIAPLATGYALDVESLTMGAHFEDMTFTAQPASLSAAGSSSIAVMVNASKKVSLMRGGATAGAGATGTAGGALASNACASSLNGTAATTITGGAQGFCTDTPTDGNCPVYGSSIGGQGGSGGSTSLAGGPGGDGGATPEPTVTAPYDGKGEPGSGIGPITLCTSGDPGGNGAPQAGGSSGGAGSLGSGGWVPVLATAGKPGNPGQGGGGGGGSVGIGGAGGAAGGCGGNGGGGGGGGGASIAIAVVNSDVALTKVSLQTGMGGAGGTGGQGAQGQAGGAGGSLGASECYGGNGGQGAGGSGGGGGAGGPSVGVGLATGGTVSVDGSTITPPAATLATPSSFSGLGGGSGVGTHGPSGLAAPGDPGNPGQAGNPGNDGPNGAGAAVAAL